MCPRSETGQFQCPQHSWALLCTGISFGHQALLAMRGSVEPGRDVASSSWVLGQGRDGRIWLSGDRRVQAT